MSTYDCRDYMLAFVFLVALTGMILGAIAVAGKGVSPYKGDSDLKSPSQSNLYGGDNF